MAIGNELTLPSCRNCNYAHLESLNDKNKLAFNILSTDLKNRSADFLVCQTKLVANYDVQVSIDLASAALLELEFLKAVDDDPQNLYDKDHVHRAVYR
jgi:hypothetical protein